MSTEFLGLSLVTMAIATAFFDIFELSFSVFAIFFHTHGLVSARCEERAVGRDELV